MSFALLGLALASSCGRSALPERARLARPELSWVEERDISLREVWRTVRVPAGSRRWGASVEQPQQLTGEGGSQVYVWKNGGILRVLGPIDPGQFDWVELHGRFRGLHHFELSLLEGDEVLSKGFSFAGATSPDEEGLETVVFDLPELRVRERPFDSLTIKVQGPDCEVLWLELVDTPLEAHLPPPHAPELMRVGEHYRRGVGLLEDWRLEARFAAEPGDRLEFAFALHERVAAPTEAPLLRISLESSSERLERTLPLQGGPVAERSWTPLSLPLDAFAGSEVRARFELEHSGEELTACALTDLRVGCPGRRAPTVLLITSDTHRGDHLGAARAGVEVLTPSLDALARRGVLFEDCYSTSNITSPSHSALLTGLTPRDTGIVTNFVQRLSSEAFTLAEAFRDAGYRTFSVVNADHLGPEGAALGQGFERQTVLGSASLLIEWLDEAEGQPVFAWLHVMYAHSPYEPAEPFDRAYYPADRDPFDPALPDPAIDTQNLHAGLAGVRDLEFPKAQYRGEISYLDHELARLLEHPRIAAGVVGFTADHGEVLVRDESAFAHLVLLPDTLHVPMILAWPGAPAEARVARPVNQIDMGRTMLDLAGVAAPGFPGTSLLDQVAPSERAARPRFALGDGALHASVAADRWFLVLYLQDVGTGGDNRLPRQRHQVLLYDVRADPDCLRDVAAAQPDITPRMRELLVTWLNEATDLGLADESQTSDEQMAILRALGYAGETAPTAIGDAFPSDCTCGHCAPFR